jgi:SAM-dependent methyltransferase
MLAVSAAAPPARRARGGRVRLSREATQRIGWVLDNLLPPVIRDSRAVMGLAFRLFYRDQAETFMEFKTRVWTWTDEELTDVYRGFAHRLVERPTDLSRRSFDAVLVAVEGPTVLEAGFGKGLLAEALSRTYDVTAVDFVVDPEVEERLPAVTFVAANVEELPFDDRVFDTVVFTHTLEHVRDFPAAVAELRRVAARRLVVMVPMQRPLPLHVRLPRPLLPLPALAAGGDDGAQAPLPLRGRRRASAVHGAPPRPRRVAA